jgi:hypothetical protein
MTTEMAAVPQVEEAAPRPVVVCAFCRRRLAGEYYFTCIKCEASYCYIHMSRHLPASCARLAGRRRRAQAAPILRRHAEELPLVVAGSKPGGASSANV